jgi:hypothetical protein
VRYALLAYSDFDVADQSDCRALTATIRATEAGTAPGGDAVSRGNVQRTAAFEPSDHVLANTRASRA